ncbi:MULTISPECIES: LCP family glycopolymer transferase [Leuconostoc]|uniref:Transcriptional regulator n=2 Tax=Leuconostoc citreum TaxID=33964 RepID=B1MX16_LEUCK|nr:MULTISPECIES: LCP family protein [Leuconostoc]ACA82068.1 Transcriptional regulator [Leuconostoc citreum KM20]KAF0260202.1 transcriptional regulator [Leuconostoc citreum]MBA5938751.1 LCP family protein [Leuconostoc citreum]MCS8583964.1 LytR family transcriptional regulator [Leuconostoc citreum]MCS8595692.1 LytR family transcriptional regulator [Leuconostoc citreum]
MDNQNLSRTERREQQVEQNHHGGDGRPPKKPRRRRRIWRWLLALVLLLAVIGGVVFATVLNNVHQSINKMQRSADITKARQVSQVIKDGKPFSMLVLGTDTGALKRDRTGLTDSMMLITVNPKTKTTTMMSIPRDIMMSISGAENTFPQKLNAAFPIAGVGASMLTLQNYLNVPIDFYVLVNMGGLEKLIDQVGGVKVASPLTFTYTPEADTTPATYKFFKDQEKFEYAKDGKNFKTYTTMNGDAALSFSRMRYDDPQGDYGRQLRQRLVLKALLKKSASISTLMNAKFMASISTNVETDMTYSDIMNLAKKYMPATKNQVSDHMQGVGDMYGGVSYQMVPESEKQRVTNKLRQSLDLSAKKTGTQFGSNVPQASLGVAENNLSVINEILDPQ